MYSIDAAGFKTLFLKRFNTAAGVIHMVDIVVLKPCTVISSAHAARQTLDPGSIAG